MIFQAIAQKNHVVELILRSEATKDLWLIAADIFPFAKRHENVFEPLRSKGEKSSTRKQQMNKAVYKLPWFVYMAECRDKTLYVGITETLTDGSKSITPIINADTPVFVSH